MPLEEVETIESPEWLTTFCPGIGPQVPKKLLAAVEQKWTKPNEDPVTILDDLMSNFATRILSNLDANTSKLFAPPKYPWENERFKKDLREAERAVGLTEEQKKELSHRLRMTGKYFSFLVRHAITEDDLKQKQREGVIADSTFFSQQLLPLFVELINRGYEIHPDLTL